MAASNENKERNKDSKSRHPPADMQSTIFKDAGENNDLFATIKNGTANVATLKLLVPGFELLEELGRGAFGVVYRARDEKLDRQVAIKVSLLDDPSRREQYIKEAKNAAKLESPGIVPVFQVGTLSGGQPFVVQRLIAGSTLRKLLSDGGNLELRHACWLLSEIAGALAMAHSVGMIHRDLKPDNILIDSAGKPWVADFGLAILEEDRRHHSGERAGTPLYMSPEQLRGQTEWLDGRADIYAMGIMLYEMLVGRTPFDARSLSELEEQVFHREPKPISQRNPSIPTVIDVIFQNCCAKQVSDRYSNAFELVEDLEAVMAELPAADTSLPLPNKAGFTGVLGRRTNSPVAVSVRRKTIRQAGQLRATLHDLHVPKDWSALKWVYIPLGLVCAGLLILLTNGWLVPSEMNGKLDQPKGSSNEAPQQATTSAQSNRANPIASVRTSDEKAPKPEVSASEPAVVIPARPFRVSKGLEGTHTTLAAAIAMAHDGETVTVLPGYYSESLTLERSVRLVGAGDREDIVIIGANQAALVIQSDVTIELVNLTLEGDKSIATEFNTIELNSGKLVLNNCTVNSRSYDCVKVQPGSAFSANQCNFRTSSQPAIRAAEASQLSLIDCLFDIRPSTSPNDIPVGIQATQCTGLVQRCTFDGAGSAYGIHWQAADGLVSIQDCTFRDCKTGAIFQDCNKVEINGTARTQINDCKLGLLFQRSAGLIKKVNFGGSQGENAMRLIDEGQLPDAPRIEVSGCSIVDFATAISIEHAHVSISDIECKNSSDTGIQLAQQSHLAISKSHISNSGLAGLLLEDATATLVDCQITDCDTAGVSVDARGDALFATGCTFQDNLTGLLIYSGSVKLQGGGFLKNTAGILVMERAEKNSEREPTFLDIEEVDFRDNEKGAFFIRAPCSYRIQGGEFSDPANKDKPRVEGGLRSEKDGAVVNVRPNST